MWRREPRTWLELLARRVGYARMLRVSAFVTCWAIVRDELEHEPTVEEYAEWWRTSLSTAYRDLHRFEEALPEFEGPGDFVDQLGEVVELRQTVPSRYGEGLV